MIKLLTLILIPSFSYLNRVRGTNKEKRPRFLPWKVACYTAIALIYAAIFFIVNVDLFYSVKFFSLPTGLLSTAWISLGLWLCFSFGWGKYYPHGLNKIGGEKIWKEKEFLPADLMSNLIIGKWNKDMPISWVRNWQTVAMCARFQLTFGLIFFPILAFILSDWYIAAIGSLSFINGFLYRLAFNIHTSKSQKNAEYYTGAFIGLQLALTIGILS